MLSNEYVIACENPVNWATSEAASSILCSNEILPIVVSPLGRVVGMLSYPKNLATSSATSAMQWISWRKVGATISFVSGSRVSSTFARYASISSFVRSVPRSALMRSGSNGTLEGSLTSLQISTHPPTTSPAPSSSISWHARSIAAFALFGSSPFSNLPDASVRSPILLEERRMFVPLKHAASKSTVCTLSVIMEFSPPMIPAMPTAFFPSQIIRT